MSETFVRVDRSDDGVTRLCWHRPKAANAFDGALVEQILDSWAEAVQDTSVLVLTGEGGRFSAGFDLTSDTDDRALAWRFGRAEALLAHVRTAPCVTVAAVQGPAFGLGADLVASCDYRLGDDRARFRFPGSRFGIVLGTHQLVDRVGRFRATDLLLRNEVVPADQALADGLLTHRLSAAEQADYVATLASDLADLEPHPRNTLLGVLRPDVRAESAASLLHSSHANGLGDRVAEYSARARAASRQ